MAYNKKTWKSKELITKDALNNIENGINDLYNELPNYALKTDIPDMPEIPEMPSMEGLATEEFVNKMFMANEKFKVSHAPEGTIVDYREKEVRVMCPADTEWTLQNSGENADPNKYYIGFKAYAPENAMSFKEDLARTIADETMCFFENNEFAGIEEDGRKYSIIWLPAAVLNESEWNYYGKKSNTNKFIGWFYSVEWFDKNGDLIGSDCIRINLSNEDCHGAIESHLINELKAEIAELRAIIEELKKNN